MSRRSWTTAAVLVTGIGIAAQTPAPTEEALGGLDPVLLVQGKETDGLDRHAVEHAGLTYYFASPETRAAFEREPSRYAVQLDGMCARMGPPVGGSPALFGVHAGRIYVFGSEDCRTRFLAAPAKYLDTAPSLVPQPTAASRKEGEALLARAAAALGPVDAVATLREQSTTVIPTMNRGDVTIANTLTIAFPDRWRRDMSGAFGDGTLIVTPAEAVTLSARRAPRQLPAAAVAYERGLLHRRPLVLLRSRHQPGFVAVALPAAADAAGREVAVAFQGVEAVLGIESGSGRIVSERMRGRSPSSGEVGELRLLFSDFRQAGHLMLPHRIEASVDGTPAPQLGAVMGSIETDVPLDPALFARPGA
jgi:YHS domain-containing protein